MPSTISSKVLLLVMLACLSLAGCETKVRTVNYYMDNPDEREKVLEDCRAEFEKGYALEGNDKENCQNARKANNKHMTQSIRDAIN